MEKKMNGFDLQMKWLRLDQTNRANVRSMKVILKINWLLVNSVYEVQLYVVMSYENIDENAYADCASFHARLRRNVTRERAAGEHRFKNIITSKI